ncbi:MAG: transglutaminase family protein [Steroidobacteraceae bacterium]
MRITVRHETRYRYTKEVGFGRHRLVLRPREGHDLALLEQRLIIQPEHVVSWQRDVHDNVIAYVDFEAPSAVLTFINEFVVRRVPAFPSVDAPALTWPVEYDEREAALVTAYREPNFPEDAAAVGAWLTTVAPASVLDLCATIHDSISYRRRMERGVQTPAQTLELASGSCRDLATLLMEAARRLGIAARFASGYFHCNASIAGRASTHAWAEVYLPGIGWQGLDPTLGSVTDLRHIVVGVSHHPRGVMPVSGTFTGSHADLLEHSVAVTTSDEDAEAPVSNRS